MIQTSKLTFTVVENTPERLVLQEKINEAAQNFMIEKAKLLFNLYTPDDVDKKPSKI